jgi:hypothetical protein
MKERKRGIPVGSPPRSLGLRPSGYIHFAIALPPALATSPVVMKADGNERKIALPFSFSYF